MGDVLALEGKKDKEKKEMTVEIAPLEEGGVDSVNTQKQRKSLGGKGTQRRKLLGTAVCSSPRADLWSDWGAVYWVTRAHRSKRLVIVGHFVE